MAEKSPVQVALNAEGEEMARQVTKRFGDLAMWLEGFCPASAARQVTLINLRNGCLFAIHALGKNKQYQPGGEA